MWVNKTYHYFFFLGLLSFISIAQNTAIPDTNFEQTLIDLGYDSGPINGLVPTANISNLTNLDVSFKNITNLTGIEDFKALTVLECSNNLISNLNVFQNTNLEQLFCSNNQLTNLDVSVLADLNIFWCANNRLTNLNVTQNTKLISLVCDSNQLSSLDITKNLNLNVFVCESNQLTNINVSKNTNLSRFECGNNLLSNLNISQNSSLVFLSCEQNELTSLDTKTNSSLGTLNCSFNYLSELNLSKNSNLTTLNCSNNQLCKLNVKNSNNTNGTVNFSNNLNLNCVVVDNPSSAHANWLPTNFSNYVSAQDQCNNFVNVDTINSVVTNTSYTLPTLTYGNYFTEPRGQGVPLFTGDVITTSQTIYIYNESICANNESRFNVLITSEDYYIPKYFTPNNDGMHDVWKVQDFNNNIKTIAVFDRYGKLLKYLPANAPGWDGSFNGKLLESNDYWYFITLNTGETIKGHFTLKR
ncbi:T9SS type B sorting domain-containing protein [Mariniflexile litorale]|uniref:T9SS type B sorting domain-containing protein n=1 Tax=Mariniflexile litorale TaxID=3045158 RepID=A0AAU7EJX2_9FLAO|nr:T9SS type B sorting domain-containing protein [Mariniflexile sp. KMM 9835]MDQ8211293.1 T9SS type B sorting domain-containing protein [Mariniflexile sp. KMM 9835]